jgi:hypothetical protein
VVMGSSKQNRRDTEDAENSAEQTKEQSTKNKVQT